MLNDAVAAESYKFRRNRSNLFWGFCFVPAITLLFNLALETYLKWHSSGPISIIAMVSGLGPRVDLAQQVIRTLGSAGSSLVQIFFAIGAAAIFAGEYRWETWRLLMPRNSRVNLLAAKFIVYAIACALSLIALGFAALIYTFFGTLLNGTELLVPQTAFAGPVLGAFLVSWAELLVLGAFTALVAVGSRAMIGALLAGIFFSFAQTIVMEVAHLWDAPLKDFAILPNLSAELLRAWVTGRQIAPGVFADPAKVLPAVGFLAAWIVVLSGAALSVFQRQDLPRE